MKNTDKVTLTLGQIKRLIREANNDLESQLKDAQEKLKQARKEYKAKQGHGMSGVFLKKAEDKVAELKKQIKKSNSVKESKEADVTTWRGIPGTKFIWNGEVVDPEVEYDGEIINAIELEDFAWDQYKQECKEKGKDPSEEEFNYRLPVSWFKKKLDEFMFGRFGDFETDSDDDYYDGLHAKEWMERHPNGYYNSENDYGDVDESYEDRRSEFADEERVIVNSLDKISNQLNKVLSSARFGSENFQNSIRTALSSINTAKRSYMI